MPGGQDLSSCPIESAGTARLPRARLFPPQEGDHALPSCWRRLSPCGSGGRRRLWQSTGACSGKSVTKPPFRSRPGSTSHAARRVCSGDPRSLQISSARRRTRAGARLCETPRVSWPVSRRGDTERVRVSRSGRAVTERVTYKEITVRVSGDLEVRREHLP